MGDTVTAVVLGAGAAQRMGEPKLLLPFGGSTILNATMAAVEASRADRVIVVTGADAEAVEDSMDGSTAMVVRNADYRRGNMSSFLTAVAADPETDAFLLVPGDMPEIQTEVLDALVDLWHAEAPWAAVTVYTDRVAHPLLVSSEAVPELSEASGEKVLGRVLIEQADDRVVRHTVATSAPRDVNTPGEYEALLAEKPETKAERR
jgi:molybdenum cofactor cytidylyltransferase